MSELGVKVLDLPMGDNDADANTIRDYLKLLVLGVWNETEGFDGKRPFGNSSWWTELYNTLYRRNFIDGEVDKYNDIQYDSKRGNELIIEAINSL